MFKSFGIILLIIISVSAIDWCEDVEAGIKRNERANLPENKLKGSKKCRKRTQVNISKAATLPIKNRPDLCNFFTKTGFISKAPW